jgi:PAS domain S-box-containing protein
MGDEARGVDARRTRDRALPHAAAGDATRWCNGWLQRLPPAQENGAMSTPLPASPHDAAALALVPALAGVGWFSVAADRTVTAVSPEMERITGFTASEAVGRPCVALLRCRECLRGCALFRTGTLERAEGPIFRSDGGEITVERSGRVLKDATGRVTGAIETVRPVDGDGCARGGPPPELDALLESLGRSFVVLDGELKVLACSRSLAALAGVEPDAVRGAPASLLFGEELFGASGELAQAVLRGERREGWAGSVRTAGGERVGVSLSVGAVAAEGHCGRMGARAMVMVRPEHDPDDPGEAAPAFHGMVARSPAMHRIFRLIELLRDTDATVLVTGESGTGKEMVARALHDTSARAHGPFVAVNCAAIPSELLESELFGHVRGAFTGAVRDRPGRFELARGGTLFLDEIGDLAPALQAKLLRVLQEHAYERVGDARPRTADVRVIAATHLNLQRAVAEGRFREDLYYRLRVVPIELPPLRERREDLPPLVHHLMSRIGARRRRALRLSPAALRAVLSHPWPGNVRELENALEYATTVCDGQTVHLADLPAEVALLAASPAPPPAADLAADAAPAPLPALRADEAAEAARIRGALQQAQYRRDDAARLLGMSRTTLWRKIKTYRL